MKIKVKVDEEIARYREYDVDENFDLTDKAALAELVNADDSLSLPTESEVNQRQINVSHVDGNKFHPTQV